VRVHLCGVRGSTPAPGAEFVRYGGHTACIAIAHDGADTPTLILDSGTGVRSVSALLGGAPFAGTILYSHLHWDHVQGLPFFAAADNDGSWVRVFIPQPDPDPGLSAEALLERAMSPPHFPITPAGLRGDWAFQMIAPGDYEHEGFAVLAREVPHKGGRTLGYRVSDGHSTLTYIPDHSPTRLGVGEEGLGAYHPAAVELAKDADALIHDAQLLPEEFIAESEFGHSVADYAVGLGRDADARTVILFHHAPERTDDALDALGDRFDRSAGVIVAVQGSVLEL
jgi:phosphoribosyl 1,2-cyclic phosphodiesterase